MLKKTVIVLYYDLLDTASLCGTCFAFTQCVLKHSSLVTQELNSKWLTLISSNCFLFYIVFSGKELGHLKNERAQMRKMRSRIIMTIVNEIVDSPNVTRFYGVYKIGDHGVFIINREKDKLLLGRKLSQQRKPTA